MSTADTAAYHLTAQQRQGVSAGVGPTRFAVTLHGPLEHDRLQTAITAVTNRHEALRTSLWRREGLDQFLQRIDETAVLDVQLESDGDDRHTLRVEWGPHAGDARSCVLFVDELAQAYDDLVRYERRPPPVQYAEYASWQEEVGPLARERWMDSAPETLSDAQLLATETVPVDAPWLTQDVVLDPMVTRAMVEACRSRGLAPESGWAAAWTALLWRRGGYDRSMIAHVIDGRVSDELADAVGPYELAVPVAIDLDDGTAFERLLVAVDDGRRQAQRLHAGYEPSPDGLRGAVAFAHHRIPPPSTAGGVSFALGESPAGPVRPALQLTCKELGDSWRLWVEADPCRVVSDALNELAMQLAALVRSAVADPSRPVAVLAVADAPSGLAVGVHDRSSEGRAPAEHDTIHDRFDAQVRRTPQRLAVVCGDETLTFAELAEHANRLARRLQALGAGPDQLVGVCVERSVQMVVAILGVLKAGSAYLPLDPGTLNPGRRGYPAQRLRFMLEDTELKVLVAQTEMVADLPAFDGEIVDIDNLPATEPGDEPPISGSGAANLAYAIYTSGSTGRPKAALIEHRSAANLWRGIVQEAHLDTGAEHRASLNAPIGFDPSVQQILQLLHGATLVVVPEDIRADGRALLTFIDEHQIDLWDCTPHQLRLLARAGLGTPGRTRPLTVLCGGEAMSSELWNSFADRTDVRVYNVYGPTECTVDTTIAPVRGSQVTIGRPLPGCATYVLDPELQPLPAGVVGELWIGGAGVARGYLHRDELTAARFRANPFGAGRLYQTGDRVRWWSDGRLEFLGRRDGQVKIRSHRIETGEVEAVLRQLPEVDDAVVVARTDDGERRLVAYVVERAGVAQTTSAYREHLKRWLPEYMIPAAFVPLDCLPMTANGKLDVVALPAPLATRPDLDVAYLAPRDDLEASIAQAWARIFARDADEIGTADDFFDLGGDSLMAVDLVTELEETFSLELPLDLLMERTTVSSIADTIREIQSDP